jgi:hypothetical protein
VQRLVVRNGHLPEREVISGAGPIPVRQPRVRHRDKGRFTSAILPKYMRRVPSVDALIPARAWIPDKDKPERIGRGPIPADKPALDRRIPDDEISVGRRYTYQMFFATRSTGIRL